MNKTICVRTQVLLWNICLSENWVALGVIGEGNQEEIFFNLYAFYISIIFNSMAAQIIKKVIVKDEKT